MYDDRRSPPPDSPATGLGVRRRFARALRRVLHVLAPPDESPSPALPMSADAARLRARRALADARAQMPGLLSEPHAPSSGDYLASEAGELRQALRAYTDRIDRVLIEADLERRSLHEQVQRLTVELLAVRSELGAVRAVLAREQAPRLVEGTEQRSPPPPGVVEPGAGADTGTRPEHAFGVPPPAAERPSDQADVEQSPPSAPAVESVPTFEAAAPAMSAGEPVPVPATGTGGASAEPPAPAETAAPSTATASTHPASAPVPATPEQARLDARVFPAGTVGIVVSLMPVEDAERLAAVAERLAAEPVVEHAEPAGLEDATGRVRLTFRRPVPWPRLRAAIEAATGEAVDPLSVTVARGEVRLTLHPAHPAAGTRPHPGD